MKEKIAIVDSGSIKAYSVPVQIITFKLMKRNYIHWSAANKVGLIERDYIDYIIGRI